MSNLVNNNNKYIHTLSNLFIQTTGISLTMDEPKSDDRESSLLVVILDTNPSQRIIRKNPQLLTACMDSVVAFSNAHVMQRASNQLVVMACHHHATEFLYPLQGKPLEIRQIDGQYEMFTMIEKTIKARLAILVNSAPKILAPTESQLAGSIAMALCHINRLLKSRTPGLGRVNTRILVITGSNECASQYMTYMNVFFTAQKKSVVIDVCALDKNLTLLQQGCDITGGQYLKVPQLEGLLQYLLWVFLPDPATRQKLVLPPAVKVDYRAACFCHRELIDIGYVCSVCLSIFCKFSPICTTCHTVFKAPGPIAGKPKKRKVKG